MFIYWHDELLFIMVILTGILLSTEEERNKLFNYVSVKVLKGNLWVFLHLTGSWYFVTSTTILVLRNILSQSLLYRPRDLYPVCNKHIWEINKNFYSFKIIMSTNQTIKTEWQNNSFNISLDFNIIYSYTTHNC